MWLEKLTGSLEQKKQYKQNRARIEALPEPHKSAAKALERYFMYNGGITDGETLITMQGDFVDLWEQAVSDGTTVAALIGDDPVAFADTFVQSYAGKNWIDKERGRLTKAIDAAVEEEKEK